MSQNNTTVLIGRLTHDPDFKFVSGGIAICKFGIAVSEKRGENEKTSFFDVTCWRGVAEEAGNVLRKGSAVVVIGTLELEQWDDKATGQKRSKVSVTANTVATPLYRAKDAPQRAATPPQAPPSGAGDDEPIPF